MMQSSPFVGHQTSVKKKDGVCEDICIKKKKDVPSAVGFPHCAGSGEGLFLNPKLYPHKCAEAGARTRDLPVTDGSGYLII